jgi:hypothetical protein
MHVIEFLAIEFLAIGYNKIRTSLCNKIIDKNSVVPIFGFSILWQPEHKMFE